jgi:hypothetical protein
LAADVLAADEVVLLSKPGRQTQSSALLAFVYSGVLEPSAQAVQFSVSCDRKKPAMHATHDSGSKASGVVSGEASGVVSGEASGGVSGEASGVVSGEASGVVSGEASGVVSGKASGVVSGEASGVVSGEASGEVVSGGVVSV